MALRDALHGVAKHAKALEFVRGLIGKVAIPARPTGGCEVELIGNIMKIVDV